jgi:DNA-directed RNA polymerase subunit beta'
MGAARVETTVGRALVGRLLPAGLPFDRVNCELGERGVRELGDFAERRLAPRELRDLLERLWAFGLACVERHGLSLACDDMAPPATKPATLAEAYTRVAKIEADYLAGQTTGGERYNDIMDALAEAADRIWKDAMVQFRGGFHPLYVMADSGASGSRQQLRQLVAMRGVMARANGELREVPVAHSLAEGLTAHEFALSAVGPRRGLLEDAAREADAASLSERVARAVRALRVTEEDCGTTAGRTFEWVEPRQFSARVLGHAALGDVRHPGTGEVLVRDGEPIDASALRAIEAAEVRDVTVRWPAGCRARGGVCRRCYGAPSALGDAVGLKAALALREHLPGLVRRVFHIC